MDRLAVYARAGDRLVTFLALILVLLMLLYGGYSLYDNYLLGQGGYSSELMKYKPSPGNVYSLAELMKINPDVIGWITIDDTNIDQPVTQGKDDMEYVNKDALGQFSLSGAVFLSSMNDKEFNDPYSLTYGHHMDSGGMYGDVTEFLKKDFFEKHKTGSLLNLESVWDIEVFAVMETDASDPMVYNVSQYQNSDVSSLNKYLKKKAKHYRDIGIKKTDQIISLSTCYDATTNARVIVFGKLENKQSGGDLANNEKSF